MTLRPLQGTARTVVFRIFAVMFALLALGSVWFVARGIGETVTIAQTLTQASVKAQSDSTMQAVIPMIMVIGVMGVLIAALATGLALVSGALAYGLWRRRVWASIGAGALAITVIPVIGVVVWGVQRIAASLTAFQGGIVGIGAMTTIAYSVIAALVIIAFVMLALLRENNTTVSAKPAVAKTATKPKRKK